jgi:hypothetical protein
MAEGMREWLSVWEDFGIQPEEYRELDGDRVLVLTRGRGRGKASGLELGHMHAKAANLLHIRGDKVTRLVAYNDRDRALADLGLTPEDDSP